MPTVNPSLAGLDARDQRLVKAYVALRIVHEFEPDKSGLIAIQAFSLCGWMYEAMSAHARVRCQQWQQRYSAVKAAEVHDASL